MIILLRFIALGSPTLWMLPKTQRPTLRFEPGPVDRGERGLQYDLPTRKFTPESLNITTSLSLS